MLHADPKLLVVFSRDGPRTSSPFGGYPEKSTRARRRDCVGGGGGGGGFAGRFSRGSLRSPQIGELARRLSRGKSHNRDYYGSWQRLVKPSNLSPRNACLREKRLLFCIHFSTRRRENKNSTRKVK